MAVSIRTRAFVLAGLLAAGVALVAGGGPASAQTTPLRFSSQCTNTGATGNAVDVPPGSTVNGVLVTGTSPVTVTETNATVVFPNGSTAIVNEVIPGPPLTRNAVRIISGPGAGTIIGQVVCGPTSSEATPLVGSGIEAECPPGSPGDVDGGTATIGVVSVGNPAGGRCTPAAASADGVYTIGALVYPLAVDANAPAGAPALAAPSASLADGGTGRTALLLIVGAVGLVLAQVTVGVRLRRRARQFTG